MRVFLLLLLCLPLIEIAVLIMIGSKIGVFATIALVILTGLAGSYLLRSQGFSALTKLRREMESGHAPDKQVAHAAIIVLAGILLILPGFVSDLIGIALFIPFIRNWVVESLASRVTVVRPNSRSRETVVDLDVDEYHRMDDDDAKGGGNASSPWRLPSDKQ